MKTRYLLPRQRTARRRWWIYAQTRRLVREGSPTPDAAERRAGHCRNGVFALRPPRVRVVATVGGRIGAQITQERGAKTGTKLSKWQRSIVAARLFARRSETGLSRGGASVQTQECRPIKALQAPRQFLSNALPRRFTASPATTPNGLWQEHRCSVTFISPELPGAGSEAIRTHLHMG